MVRFAVAEFSTN